MLITKDEPQFPLSGDYWEFFLLDHFVTILKPVSSEISCMGQVYPKVPLWLLVPLCWQNHTSPTQILLQAQVAAPSTPGAVGNPQMQHVQSSQMTPSGALSPNSGEEKKLSNTIF